MMTECARRWKDISIQRMCFAIGSFICCTFVYIDICISLSHLNNTRFRNQFNSTELSGLIFTNLYSTKKSKWERKKKYSVSRSMLPLYTAKPVFLFYRIFGEYAVFCFMFLSTIRHTFASTERSNKFKLNLCEHATQSTVMSIIFLILFSHWNIEIC